MAKASDGRDRRSGAARAAALRRRAERAWEEGRLDAAVAAFRRAAVHDPGDPVGRRRLANALKAAGRAAEALAAYRIAVCLDPASADLLRQYGNVLRDGGGAAAAVGVYRRSLALRPDAAALRQLRLAFLVMADVAAERTACRAVLALEPDNPEAWLGMAEAACRCGELAAARAGYHALGVLRPDSTVAAHNVAVLDSLIAPSLRPGAFEAQKESVWP